MGLDLALLAYNVFLRPPAFLDGQRPRSLGLGAFLAEPRWDAIVLCEVFDRDSRERLLAALEGVFPHRSLLVGGGVGWRANGGVMVLSRWPIEAQAERLYEVSAGPDALAYKGAVYVRLRKEGRAVHVFGTHTQAMREHRTVREQQLRSLRRFVDAQRIPTTEPVLLAGDFNVATSDEDEHAAMLAILGASMPAALGHPYTYHPGLNPLAVHGDEPLRIDHVLVSARHLLPDRADTEVLRPRTDRWRALPWRPWCTELSDHYPVLGRFRF